MKKLISMVVCVAISCFVSPSQAGIPIKSDTQLIKTVKHGNYKQVKQLLKSGTVFVNGLGIDHKTAMDIAVEFGDTKTAILLSKYGGKVTRADNMYQFKSMLRNIGKRKLKIFLGLILLCWIPLYYFGLAITATESCLAYLALSIPTGIGVVTYAWYQWSSLFKGLFMCSQAELSWMIDASSIA